MIVPEEVARIMVSHKRNQEYVRATGDRSREELIFALLSFPIEADVRISRLVCVLNDLPEVYTVSSCGGHPDPADRENPAPEGYFYVQFIVEPTDKGFLSLGIIDLAARNLDHDNLSLKVLNCTDNPKLVMFHVLGREEADPDAYADEIASLARAWGLPENEGYEYKRTVRKEIAVARIRNG